MRAGGSLLLVADHAPAGAAAAGLSAAFGVEMTNWWAEDERHHDPETSSPGFLVFTREAGLLDDHPIMLGRSPGEQVHRVMTFTGQALRPGAGAALLTLSSTAREYPFRQSREYEGRSAAGLAQAVALEHGAGRVVILGEAAMITAQTTRLPDGTLRRFGMNRDGHRQSPVRAQRHALAGRRPRRASHEHRERRSGVSLPFSSVASFASLLIRSLRRLRSNGTGFCLESRP